MSINNTDFGGFWTLEVWVLPTIFHWICKIRPFKVSAWQVIVMLHKEKLMQITEEAIDNLMLPYKMNPYYFHAENDSHSFLYRERP